MTDTLSEILESAPKNDVIVNNLIKAYSILNNDLYENKICTISGGADSDVVLDIVTKCCEGVKFVFFDTGLEYQATKTHLDELEKKYNIKIERVRIGKPIPTVCREKGEPFISKLVSEFIYRLQRHGFKWEDKPFEVLMEEYPQCISALKWWCNLHSPSKCIKKNKYLKEFLIENPPSFKISNLCCTEAKKKPLHKITKDVDLNIYGVRKSEGGARLAIKNCFTEKDDIADYRPIFFYKDNDKQQYCEHYGIKHSKCYTEYGLARTGCAGCPFGRNFELELEVLKKYEPKLYVAVNNIFKNSYEYTRQYHEFRKQKEMEDKKKKKGYQYNVCDYLN